MSSDPNQHLIGFVRENSQIIPIKSTSNTIYDTVLKSTFKAVFVPLAAWKTDSEWTLNTTKDTTFPPILNKLFQDNLILITTDTPKTPYYALMYAPTKEKSMSRTGYLCKKEGNTFTPITITLDNNDYLIEFKGCGSPEGGFPHTHRRNQAGCSGKQHIKLTGALGEYEAIKEYDNLRYCESLYNQLNEPLELKTLGYNTFQYLDTSFSILIRLTPSSLRGSFTDNPALTPYFPESDAPIFQSLGRHSALHLHHTKKLHHHNINRNNALYQDKNNFILTDWSEAEPITTPHCAMDYCLTTLPIEFLNRSYPKENLRPYLEGFAQASPDALKNTINTTLNTHKTLNQKNILEINQTIINYLYKDLQNYTQTILDSSTLIENIQLTRNAYPASFFNTSTHEWASNTLLPLLKTKLEIQKDYTEYLTSHTLHDLHNNNAYHQHLLDTYPLIQEARILPHLNINKENTASNALDIGKFLTKNNLLNQYITLPKDQEELTIFKEKTTTLLSQCKAYATTQSLSLPPIEDILFQKLTPSTPNLSTTLYPFLFLTLILFENHRLISGTNTHASHPITRHLNTLDNAYKTSIPEFLKILKKIVS